MSVRGIFFDAGGVLYQRTSPTAEFALRLLREQHFFTQPSPRQARELEALRGQASQGQVGHEAYWQQFLRLHGVEEPDRRAELIRQITDFSNNVQPVEGCAQALTGLKARGFTLGIVTDTIYPLEWKMRRLEKAGVAHLIDVVACSSTLGVHKPDPRIYQDALGKAGLAPAESAFVGHDATELLGARQAGMPTVAVFHAPGVQADFQCLSMLELLDLPLFQAAAAVVERTG